MKAVMISIQPKWCELIASGRKTIEVRKTKPKLDVPFKCYIYETKGGQYDRKRFYYDGRGKIIGYFVCDEIDTYDDDIIHTHSQEDYAGWNDSGLDRACIHEEDFENYANDKWLYGWYISDLVIYDKPKELGEFKTPPCEKSENACGDCKYLKVINTPLAYEVDCWGEDGITLTRPFQSWGYVEVLK